MNRNMRMLLFGKECECRAAAEMLRTSEPLLGHTYEICQVDDLEEFEKNLADWEPTLLVILADGAEGMECVYRARDRRPDLPVFWFSNDRGFGVQSYRLDCAYFAIKPVTAEKMNQAFHRCRHFGIQYGTA